MHVGLGTVHILHNHIRGGGQGSLDGNPAQTGNRIMHVWHCSLLCGRASFYSENCQLFMNNMWDRTYYSLTLFLWISISFSEKNILEMPPKRSKSKERERKRKYRELMSDEKKKIEKEKLKERMRKHREKKVAGKKKKL